MTTIPAIVYYDKDGKEVKEIAAVGSTPPKTVLQQINEGGTFTAKVNVLESTTTKQIGSFKVETVKVAEGTTPTSYELAVEDDTETKAPKELDLFEPTKKTVKVNVKGFYDGVSVDAAKFHVGLEAVTTAEGVKIDNTQLKNDGTFTVTIDSAAKVGDIEITLQDKQSTSYAEEKGKVTVKVVNSAPKITELSIKDSKPALVATTTIQADADKATAFTIDSVFAQLTAGKNKADVEILEKSMITNVEFLNRTVDTKNKKVKGTVVVTLDSKYASNSFKFDGEVSFTKSNADLEAELSTALAELDTAIKNAKNPATTTDKKKSGVDVLGTKVQFAEALTTEDKKDVVKVKAATKNITDAITALVDKDAAILPAPPTISTTDAKIFAVTFTPTLATGTTVKIGDKVLTNNEITLDTAVTTGNDITLTIEVPETDNNKAGTATITYTVTGNTGTWLVTVKPA